MAESLPGKVRWLGSACVACLLLAGGANAQERFLLEGTLDLEAYDTDSASALLSRNGGDVSTLGRLQLWSAAQLTPRLQAYVLLEAESDDAAGEWEAEAEFEQVALRWTHNANPHVMVEAGKLLTPFSSTMARNQSTRNPLVGQADSLYVGYPVGAQLLVTWGRLDFRAAVVDEPATRADYLPSEPGAAWRPDLGVGYSPSPGLRMGLIYTAGPYLARELQPFLPAGLGWKDFGQRLLGVEAQWSRGYFEMNALAFHSAHEVPFRSGDVEGDSFVIEMKYAWTPRFYGALRFERNEYPFIRHRRGFDWTASTALVRDLEVGLGYRFSPDTQLKLSYRADRWSVNRVVADRFPDGHWLALQLSHHFDLAGWMRQSRWQDG